MRASRQTTRLGRAMRVLGGAIGALVLVGVATTPAFAHAELESSSPSDGTSVDAMPAQVTFTFDEDVFEPAFASVIGPDGKNYSDGKAVVDGATVSQAVTAGAPAGQYKMSYRVVSDDGHPVTGSVSFTVAGGGDTTAPATSGGSGQTADSDSKSFWDKNKTVIIIVVVVLILAAAALAMTSRRPRSGG